MYPTIRRTSHIKMPQIRTNLGYHGFEDPKTDSTLSTPARIAGVRLSGCLMASRTTTYFSGHTVHHVARTAPTIGRRYSLQPVIASPMLLLGTRQEYIRPPLTRNRDCAHLGYLRRVSRMLRRARRVAHAITPNIGPQIRIIPSTNGQITPPLAIANSTRRKNPHPRSARRANPIFSVVLRGRCDRFRQNRASFWTVSGNTRLRCRASMSRSHCSRFLVLAIV